MKKDYWFRPKKFWGVFACYYPANSKGWLATLIAVFVIIKVAIMLYFSTTSVSDFWWQFLPWVLAIFAILDTLCFRFGEYPSWWKKKN